MADVYYRVHWADCPPRMFCSHMAASGPEHLRARRERTAAACRAWLAYRMS